MAKKDMTVSFGEPPGVAYLRGHLELDSDLNGGKTEFGTNEEAWCRYYPSTYATTYAGTVNKGSVEVKNTKLPDSVVDEQITFVNSSSGSLDFTPQGKVEWEWDGKIGPNPTFNGRDITLGSRFSGVLKCSYETWYDSLVVKNSEGGDVLLVVEQDGNALSLTIAYTGADGGLRDVTLTVLDYCYGEPVPYASVKVQGPQGYSAAKVTDINGQVELGRLIIGGTYTLTITKAGYIDSDEDALNNDSFTVA